MFMCVVNQKSVNKLDLTWKQSFLINLLSSRLASKSPLMCFLMSVIIAVRDIVYPNQELTISMSSESSTEMIWSIAGMLHPALTVTVWI
jgi:hypothetical protein